MKSVFQTLNLISKVNSPQELEEHLKSNNHDKNYINCLLHAAFEKRRTEFIQYLPLLIKKGANINELDLASSKNTIFMTACANVQTKIVKKMLEYPVNLQLKDTNANNALMLALLSYNKNPTQIIEIVRMLLEKQPSLAQSENKEKSVLFLAVEIGNKQLVEMLLQRKANPNFTNSDEQTALHIMARKFKNKQDQVEIIKSLVQKKINIENRNSQGRSALDLVDKDHRNTFEQLINSFKQERKRSKHDVGKQILKSNNKMIKDNIKNITIDENKVLDEAPVLLEQFLKRKIKNLELQKKRKQDEVRKAQQQLEQQRLAEAERSASWIIGNNQLKYYLQEEINLFSEEIQEHNKKDKQHYDHLIQIICDNLQSQLDVQVKVYGSFATRLCLSESDIDVVVISNKQIDSIQDASDLLQKIDKKLNNLSFVSCTKFIKSAVIPVIKVICGEQYNSKKIDITFQNRGHNGLDCVEIIKQYMNRYKELRPLAFVLKTFIYSSNLYDTYQGGLSSYGLILMIVAILQGEEALKKQGDHVMVSELLIKFLWCFGFEFDYINKAIFIQNPNTSITKQSYKGFCIQLSYPDIVPKLILIDPLNVNNNVGRSTHQIKQIQKSFSNAYTVIHTNYSCLNPECQYRKRIQKVQLPKDIQNRRARPCCILKRMFECSKAL